MLYTTRCEGARTKLCLTSHIAMELLFQAVFQGNSLFLMFYLHIVDGLPAEVMFLLPTCLALFRVLSPAPAISAGCELMCAVDTLDGDL